MGVWTDPRKRYDRTVAFSERNSFLLVNQYKVEILPDWLGPVVVKRVSLAAPDFAKQVCGVIGISTLSLASGRATFFIPLSD